MCIAKPCRVISVEGDKAIVDLEGVRRMALLDLVGPVKPGDYLVVHAGYALNKIDEEQARWMLDVVLKPQGRGEAPEP